MAAIFADDAVVVDDKLLELEISSLSGMGSALTISSSASLADLQSEIEHKLGVPTSCQELLLGTRNLLSSAGGPKESIAGAGLRHGDVVTLLRSVALQTFPQGGCFELLLTSARWERFNGRCSSAFTVLFKIKVDSQEGQMCVETWRKNDHDSHLFNCKAGTVENTQSHWMAGTQTSTAGLESKDPLGDFLGPFACAIRVRDASKCFWRSSAAAEIPLPSAEAAVVRPRERFGKPPQLHPDQLPVYSAVPGWFTPPPESSCTEFMVEIPIPATSMSIVRILIDEEGKLVRAAVFGSKDTAMSEELEEYDVSLQEPGTEEEI